jgi:hypothetical protein
LNSSGNSNTAVGADALQKNTGSFNTAVGHIAMANHTSGNNNTATGSMALVGYGFGETGNDNSAFGAGALQQNSTGERNSVFGAQSGRSNTSGIGNSALGYLSLFSNTTGIGNTSIGQGTLFGLATGSYNTALGARAVTISPDLSYATVIGADASVNCSDCLVLGRLGTNVGIGTSVPLHTLDIAVNSTLTGKSHIRLIEQNTADFSRIRMTNTGTTNFWDMSGLANSFNSNSRLNFYFSGTGDVLSLHGDGNAVLMGTLTQLSDQRLKKRIRPIDNATEAILQIGGYHYYWGHENRDPSLQSGVLAQEVKKVLPELVKEDENGLFSVNYLGLIPYLIQSLKEQQQQLEKLKQENSELKDLKATVEELKKTVEALKSGSR